MWVKEPHGHKFECFVRLLFASFPPPIISQIAILIYFIRYFRQEKLRRFIQRVKVAVVDESVKFGIFKGGLLFEAKAFVFGVSNAKKCLV